MNDLGPMIEAVRQASELCRALQGIGASSKSDDSPVTIADYAAQALICRTISRDYSGEGVIAEEGSTAFQELVTPEARARVVSLLADATGDPVTEHDVLTWLDYGRVEQASPTDRTWMIDPIDGTVGFVNNRYYAVCVGAMDAGKPLGGAIGLPKSPLHPDGGSLIYADGEQTYAKNLLGGEFEPVSSSDRKAPGEAIILESFKLVGEEAENSVRLREVAGLGGAHVELYDSQLKYSMIAAGYGDVFVRLPRNIQAEPHHAWDHAAGAALILAAGGQITAIDGTPLDFSQGVDLPHLGFIATNGHYHERMLNAARDVLGEAWGFA